ncbi:hypothetical protein F9L33_11280 [Amylibacter sp. SFDW26]|uniref:hypothetical protein n=1 Tax=Amylibacter sp. SFDW26 TaxID=2652722 RepID=UPI0012617969|nr:hypothetical protein [Amylibacter sp. SFDW26]KAB7613930.1 hypothetical protein F9L33_11280 [Amylibacter sp. SFDW26]
MFLKMPLLIATVLVMTNLMSHAQTTETSDTQTGDVSARQAELTTRFETRAELTQENVDQLLTTYPLINSTLQEMNPPQTPEMQKIMSISIDENTPYEGLGTAFEGTDVLQRLNAVAKDNGYESYHEYAQMADYLYQVYLSQSKAISVVSKTESDNPDAPKVENLPAFLQDGRQPSERRAKFQSQLSELYKEFHITDETHNVFAKNYDALMLFFNPPS